MEIKIKKLNNNAIIPKYQSRGAACFDLHACVENNHNNTDAVYQLETVAIGTGLAFEIPEGYELQVRPRSGLALKEGVTVFNSPGCVDSDYRGEVKVILFNSGPWPFYVKHGDRIAQACVVPVQQVSFLEVEELSETERGEGGFGSSGT